MVIESVNLNATNFNPGWPASCPWITTVGGTQLLANATIGSGTQEAAWNSLSSGTFFSSSGGGFSNHFPTPSYQKSVVDKYVDALKKSDPGLLKNFNENGVCEFSWEHNSIYNTYLNNSAHIPI